MACRHCGVITWAHCEGMSARFDLERLVDRGGWMTLKAALRLAGGINLIIGL